MQTAQINRVISWNTTKTAEGFKFEVSSFDYQVTPIIHATGVEATRAKAVSKAKEWARYLKAQQCKS